MSFLSELNSLPIDTLLKRSQTATLQDVRASMVKNHLSLSDFATLISPQGEGLLEPLCQKSRAVTLRRFGRVMRLFAPIYVSNECVNNCKYCGFSRNNPILRVTLSVEETVREARALMAEGFRNILLVAGEHPKFVSNQYLEECVRACHEICPSVSLEVASLDVDEYKNLVAQGAEGLTLFQESYNREVFAEMHTSGPKRDFEWRVGTQERAYQGGFRKLGISALYGLGDWRYEAICVAAHAEYLMRNCWKAQTSISMPRMRPCAGSFKPPFEIKDKEFAQLICAFRLFLPDVGLVLSTRESPQLRNGLIQIGITMMSAGSHTEPGGYTNAAHERLHQTKRGIVQTHVATVEEHATGQFDIADERSAGEVATFLHHIGYEPVWKDWDAALCA